MANHRSFGGTSLSYRGRRLAVLIGESGTGRAVRRLAIKRVVKTVFDSILRTSEEALVYRMCTSVNVYFCEDEEMRALNKSWRNKDKATDVLSFSMMEGELRGSSLGDIVISLPTAERQHAKFGTTYPEEVIRLLVHGMHHLCGFDHEHVSRREAQRMRESEERVFKEVKRYARTIFR
jgi:probable rRNA maturation factor